MAEVTYLEALRQGLWEEMKRDDRVFLLGEDIGAYGGAFKVTAGFLDEFGPQRVIDTPVSETAVVGAAAGAAHMGLRPVAEMQFIDFISCAYDIITNYVATARYRAGLATPIVVRGPSGGYVRGGPFHSQVPEAAFFHTPGLKLVCPATARDAKGLIKAAIRDDDPVIYFEHKFLYRRIKEELPENEDIVTPIGRARIAREGTDLTIVAWSAMVWKALEAAEQLAREDQAAIEVIDLRSLLPMDEAAIVASVRKTNKLLIVHEDTRTGGIAGEITARVSELAFQWLDGPIRRVTAHDTPLPYSPTLEDFVLPQTEDIKQAARALLAY
ncbi:MAG: alpha-ketoacid dehydrogenase subunit beta [Gemmatimonadota bacterium]|nr:MAG: alpha-ketoacid dehydrogenase subunit beta [Gemmatimonadota bacterium]